MRPKIMRPKDLLKRTWDKAWTKQWVAENTPFAVPNTLVFSATWFELIKWLKDTGIPQTGLMVIKPQSLSLSRGVRLVQKTEGGFLDALGNFMDISALLKDLVLDVPGSADSYKWIVEEYVWPPPNELAALQYDGPFNPLLRIIMSEGDFHFGEVHIPTNASRGRGSLRGGARRLCFDYTGKLFQTRPPVKDEPVWSVNNYGTKTDVTNLTLPLFSEIRENIKNHVCKVMAPRSLFAFDGCYRQTADKVEFVCIEIEHQPNVKHLAKFKDLRCPQT